MPGEESRNCVPKRRSIVLKSKLFATLCEQLFGFSNKICVNEGTKINLQRTLAKAFYYLFARERPVATRDIEGFLSVNCEESIGCPWSPLKGRHELTEAPCKNE